MIPGKKQLARWARGVQRNLVVLYLAVRDPRFSWYIRALALLVISYALSPVDLIPDVIPVLGLLDDIIIVPLGIVLVLRLMPPPLLQDVRQKADAVVVTMKRSLAGALLVVALWAMLLAGVLWLVVSRIFAG